MDVKNLFNAISDLGGEFFTGVPDSLLAHFIDNIIVRHGISKRHIVAANEGAAVGLAAGHYLATGCPAVVYMQNSGIGNAVNPICSLLSEKVYAIPVIFVIGWRGEPGVKDEPQHAFQGEVTLQLLDCLKIPYVVINEDTQDLGRETGEFKKHIGNGRPVAFVIRKDALSGGSKAEYTSMAEMSRERVLGLILGSSGDSDVFVCTTGKLSREVYDIREQNEAGHKSDFLTVGSMGHCIMIAYGIAISKPERRVFCLDGDGAALMHLGSLAVVGAGQPQNLVHVVINNGAHESVGGIPAVSANLNFKEVALPLKYKHSFSAANEDELTNILRSVAGLDGPVFIEVFCNLKSRGDLSRPATMPIRNRDEFMSFLSGEHL